jgi:hypothetical protein
MHVLRPGHADIARNWSPLAILPAQPLVGLTKLRLKSHAEETILFIAYKAQDAISNTWKKAKGIMPWADSRNISIISLEVTTQTVTTSIAIVIKA